MTPKAQVRAAPPRQAQSARGQNNFKGEATTAQCHLTPQALLASTPTRHSSATPGWALAGPGEAYAVLSKAVGAWLPPPRFLRMPPRALGSRQRTTMGVGPPQRGPARAMPSKTMRVILPPLPQTSSRVTAVQSPSGEPTDGSHNVSHVQQTHGGRVTPSFGGSNPTRQRWNPHSNVSGRQDLHPKGPKGQNIKSKLNLKP